MLVILFNVLLGATALYAFVRGGAPERVVAVAFIAAATASFAARPLADARYQDTEFGLLLIDVALLAVLVAVALWANRFWPIWIAAFQLFALLVHIAMLYQQDVLPIVYFVVISRIAYPMLLMLMVGTTLHFQRLKRHGADPDWIRQNI
ncbi:hypothetical protein [Sphingomonas sp. PB4P5]|uniref:hypothetical protein n=1 Tax=Parasphingomonas puruogangriensis TaxID=3096155 RepID=UPI002FC966C6